MKICKTIDEFIYEYIVNNMPFNDIQFENESMYQELFEYCMKNQDNSDYLLIIGDLYYQGKYVELNESIAFEWFKKAAELGNKKAMNNLGVCYMYGQGCEKDLNLAFYWYKKAAELGNKIAMNNLGLCYEDGKGCEKDLNLAFYWYKKAAELGNKIAMNNLGLCYKYGEGCEKDLNKAFYWYKKSAELDYPVSMSNLGLCYEHGEGCEKDLNQAFYWYKKSAESGNEFAMYTLGLCYEDGKGCEKDLNQAFYWHQKSAELGISKAMFKLGMDYYEGKGCEKDLSLAFYWFKKAAELGDKIAMHNLGVCYEYGQGCEKDPNQAFYWYQKSAELGNTRAMHNLGLCYEDGKGCEKDLNQAFYWYQKAAELGDARAMNNLGVCYTYGQGCEKDLNLAFYWFKKSAEQDNPLAMKNLGVCYEKGEGCEKDLNLAFYWYKKAAELGNKKVMNILGVCYTYGRGCEKDLNLAFYWFKKSAELDNPVSMYNLGLCYEYGEGCEKDLNLAFYWYKKSAELGYIDAIPHLAECYEKGLGCKKDLDKAIEYYKKAIDAGLEYVRESYDRVSQQYETKKLKNDNIHFSARKDVFISWNHLDLKEKDDLCANIESRNIFTVWESDGNGVGNIRSSIENAIIQAKSYIVILTGNSIKSTWVEKEVRIILDKVKSNKEYANVIRPVIINKINKDRIEEKIDVISAVNELDDSSPFKELLNYCASFGNLEVGINYDKIANAIREAIGNSIKIEYRTKIINKFDKFSAALNSVVTSRQLVSGIIAATLEFEKGYLDRDVYDENDKPYQPHELIKTNTPTLIYGEGGSGKSLYLKNFIRKEFKNDKYIFYLECGDIGKLIDTNNLMEILKQKSFDNYFTLGEAEFVSQKSFEDLITSQNKIILLVDALDELLLEKRQKLIDLIQEFLTKVPQCKIIFTSRIKLDAALINSKLHKEIDIFELRGLSLKEIEILYDNLSSKYKGGTTTLNNVENNIENGADIEISKNVSKEIFLKQLENIDEDIKKNPLLISNLIFIYFATNKMPNSSFEIITEAVTILLNDLEEERNVSFEYKEFIVDDNLYDLLGSFAVQRFNGDMNSAESLIKEYLDQTYPENRNKNKTIADAIYKYLRGRAVIVNENISHEIFKNYFVAMYIFNSVYEVALKKPLMKKYYQFKDEGFGNLSVWCEEHFQKDDQTKNHIAVDVLHKLDFEIYNLDTRKEMNEKHLSYVTFDKTLIYTLKEQGFNNEIIKAIEKLINKNSFHYNEFIIKYM